MGKAETDEGITRFLQSLAKLNTGERARLKRCAGRRLAEAPEVLGLFYRVLPPGVGAASEDTYFLTATLFPFADGTAEGNLGDSLRRARDDRNRSGLDRRVERILDADESQLAFLLRQSVRYLGARQVALNWHALLDDLLGWSYPSRSVQKRWARAYFAQSVEATPKEA